MAMNEEKPALQGRQTTENIWLCPDGVYRWAYEFDMLRNPTILFTVWKVLGISVGIVYLFGQLVMLFAGDLRSLDDLWQGSKVYLIVAGIFFVLGILGYVILAAMYGWKYQCLFEMTDEYVRHIQMPKQFKKAEAIGWLTLFVGLMAKKPSVAGLGLTTAARSASTSELKNVAVLKVRRRRHTIHVNQLLEKNQVYAEDADFDDDNDDEEDDEDDEEDEEE